MGEGLAYCHLEAVVIRLAVECGASQTARYVAQILHSCLDVGQRIRSNAVDRVARAGQPGNVVLVVSIHQIESAGSYISNLQYPFGREFILNVDIVLANQRRMDIRIQERLVQSGAGESGQVVPARGEAKRRGWIGTLVAEGILRRWIVQSDRVRI